MTGDYGRPLTVVPDPSPRGLGLIRVSMTRGRDDLASPELQRTAINGYAERHGIVMTEWREVLDESASKERSKWWLTLDEAVDLVERREVEYVVTWKFSRAARHRRRWAIALDRIEVAGGRLVSATEDVDPSTSTGRLARGVLAELAAWDAEVKGEQWKEAHARRVAQGLPHTGFPRWGYLYTRAHGYVPDTAAAREARELDPAGATAPYVVEAYRRFGRGDSVRSICRWLNSAGVRTTRGNTWEAIVLYRLLDAGFAAGLLHIRSTGEYLPGAHEPLIDQELWQQVQTTRKRGRREAPWSRKAAHTLSGLMRCDECKKGLAVASTRNRDGTVRRQYRCRSYEVGKPCRGCGSLDADTAEVFVRRWVEGMDGDLEEQARAAAASLAGAAVAAQDRDHYMRLAAKYDRQLVQLNLDRSENLMPDTKAFVAAVDHVTGLRDEALLRADDASDHERLLAQSHRPVIKALATTWDYMDVQGRRDALRQVVRKIVVARRDSEQPRIRIVPVWAPASED